MELNPSIQETADCFRRTAARVASLAVNTKHDGHRHLARVSMTVAESSKKFLPPVRMMYVRPWSATGTMSVSSTSIAKSKRRATIESDSEGPVCESHGPVDDGRVVAEVILSCSWHSCVPQLDLSLYFYILKDPGKTTLVSRASVWYLKFTAERSTVRDFIEGRPRVRCQRCHLAPHARD